MDFHRIKQIVQTEHTLQDNEWKGAVVFLCNEEFVFFIKRSDKMPTHGGQMAFVGGHKKDGETPWEVAQREFEEETSLARESLDFMGFLPMVMTARMQPIVPVMCYLKMSTKDFLRDVKSNGEWVDIVAYPWKELIQEDNWQFAWRNGYAKFPVLFHPMRRGSFIPNSQDYHTHLLWGATASMVWDFLRLYYKSSDG